MRRRPWKIEWHATPKADGIERLGRAMELLIKQGISEASDGNQEPKQNELENPNDEARQ